MRFCTKCGRQLDSGDRFCTGCGAQVLPREAVPEGEAGHSDARTAWRASPPPPMPGPPGPPTRTAAPFRPPRLEGRGAALVVVAAAVIVAVGVVVGFQVSGHHTPASASAGRAASHPQRDASAAATPAVSASSAAGVPSPTESASPLASASPSPSASSISVGTVRVSPLAAQQAGAGQVAAFLARYFAAIRHRDYAAYTSLFESQAQPVQSARQFRAGYRSTTDSAEELVSLSASPAGLAASVTFDSHQNPSASATHTACTSWQITLYLHPAGNSYLIGRPPAGYAASYAPCS